MPVTAMSRLLCCALLALAASAQARPWRGIRPGQSSAVDVLSAFGEPTKRTQVKDQVVLVYSGPRAISGTVQTQFKLGPDGETVARIDVYLAPDIDTKAIEKGYGPKCAAGRPVEPCYAVKQGAGQPPYLVYVKMGLAIFFKDDGKTVRSFAFLPESS